MNDYIIGESFTLPSKGLVYDRKVNPNIKIRSMTTEEEMKRLGHSELPYKLLAEIIDDCLVEKPGISSYDLCISDFQFLLYKLRIVTYGPTYKVAERCPVCGKINEISVDLDKLGIQEYSEEFKKYLEITLPVTKKKIELRLQTPRILDDIKSRVSELEAKSPNISGEPAFLFNLMSIIYKVDGQLLDEVKLNSFVRSLPMADANYILKSIDKIEIGIDTRMKTKCKDKSCRFDHMFSLPITGEFFGPSID